VAFCAICAICRMVTLSSSAPSATLRTVAETSSEAAATERACALDSSESDVGLAAGSRVSASLNDRRWQGLIEWRGPWIWAGDFSVYQLPRR
jgi:hypothetical protein